jgi:DNA-binding MarR family transcriptional regulator/N-acetylglutamate synthase-like GNAT family acetyltransferase
MSDIVRDLGDLFLGSRLKRIGERMQGDVLKIIEQAGLSIQPSQYPLLATLDRDGPLTVGELVSATRLSQPAVTRALARLVELDLVEVNRLHRDQRHKTVALTAAGREAMIRTKREVWPQVEAAVIGLCAELSGSLLNQLDQVEDSLARASLDQRIAAGPMGGLTLVEFSDDLAADFHDINVEWISTMFRLEQTDRDVLENPRARIIDAGGDILFVKARGLGVVGACALQKTGDGQYELTKMGVLSSARGRKAGEFLLHAMIRRAVEMQAETLYLLTNRKCAPAIHLYEKLGFQHDAEIMAQFGARYERCNVAMRYPLEAAR